MRYSLYSGLTGIALFVCVPAQAQVLVHRSYPAGANACGVATADFNLDKKLDVVFLDGGGIGVALGNGDTTFRAPIRTVSPHAGCNLVIADFNRDGKPDVVTSSGQFFAGKGDGRFAPAVDLGFSGTLVTADFNGDGKPDLAVANGSLRVLPGNGDGTFQAPILLLGSNLDTIGFAAGDFNGDGAMDLAVLIHTPVLFVDDDFEDGMRAQVMFGDGHGGFAPARTVLEENVLFYNLPTPGGYGCLAAADLNRDGRADLIAGTEDSADVLLGNADGTFTRPYTISNSVGVGGSAVAIGDFDGDGTLDLLFGTDFDYVSDIEEGVRQRLAWHRGRGDGTFAIQYTQSIPAPAALAAGDFDGDGILDAVCVSPVMNGFSIFRHAGELPAAALISTASGGDLIAAGSLVSVYSTAIKSGQATAPGGTLSLSLAGAGIDVTDARGVKFAAGLSAVLPGRIDFQMPESASPGPATIVVHQTSASDVAADLLIQQTAPSLFVRFDATRALIPAAYYVRMESNGSQTQIPVAICKATKPIFEPACTLSPINIDDRPLYLVLFGTGIAGRRSLDAVRCTFGGASLPVEYAGPSSMPGIDQVNVRLTPGLETAPGMKRVSLEIEGVSSNGIDVSVR